MERTFGKFDPGALPLSADPEKRGGRRTATPTWLPSQAASPGRLWETIRPRDMPHKGEEEEETKQKEQNTSKSMDKVTIHKKQMATMVLIALRQTCMSATAPFRLATYSARSNGATYGISAPEGSSQDQTTGKCSSKPSPPILVLPSPSGKGGSFWPPEGASERTCGLRFFYQ